MSNAIEIVARLAELWIVGKCKCFMQRSKSTTHIDCFRLEPWVVEELNVCAALGSTKQFTETSSRTDSLLYTESLDSLQMDTFANTIRWGATL
ncbi:hypothetical protein GCK32_004283 [Trichostrongylus colubriformis]|uniref:Uncharacterized protein n=1 Tax=Trichostrongylus colubriformis TaxID=6319 RepID=A0AAN8FWB6_TRICO